ncbi:ATP-dependent Clp protease ATP-binding subunit [Dysosmobacter sp.]|uniref:ATP-dependent Clp protease ATP-binding subunit n=1 Tax=Dysosmobacter sp. TaxID=2591382 RepID=UPI002A9D766C|nr:ATP-dependent Clp protease ATP-binding subunit [Dysosmobacter sp.]MCI6053856.1 ATP-dependent Clp protease ATP-binding subunit [Dysosmobacter sp.]MDY5511168.1 ATP-dependent Clp protease ATP-binding subunit [Dysosmobacter sp.]
MQPTLCSRCKKNVAVVFISRMEGDRTINEGLCLKCAKERGLPQVDEMMKRMGISDEDLDTLNSEMLQAMSGVENIEDLPGPEEGNEEEEDGKTATFPFLNRLFSGSDAPRGDAAPEGDQGRGREKERKEPKNGKRKYLENYCISLTQKAQEGKLDPVIGRAEEIERVVQILNRRQKNNPCLIGEPGVGKTAIAEGLAQRIAKGDVPFKLREKEVYLLDLTALVAGTQFRGQFESRMKGLIDEVKRLGNIILMIDEVHNIVGAGDAEGSMNAANILKPALSRGEIQVIGATTFNEYRKSIEKDTALERRFQPVTVNEPSIEDSIQILKGLAPNYEKYHGVKISEGILRQAVVLSERYITDRFLPDKAIDLIDEACSDLNLKDPDISRRMQIQRELDDYEKERTMLEEKEEKAEGDYARMAELKSRELQLTTELNALLEKGDPQLSMENVAHVIELWTKIPAAKIREQEFQRLSKLEERLKTHIVGQDEAISAVSAAVRRNRVGISPKHKPVSFIFVGSTGVGKTELVKQLATDLFNTPDALIRLDMSEFMEKHSVSRIVGSPPGYVGYDEAGQLTEKIRRKPYAVVLFDEIEKAHPDVLNVLLQILDDGEITDAHGRKVNFENTIIVMTSNAGSANNDSGTVGFGRSVSEQDADKAMKALQQFLRPEFINRVDAVITFNRLSRENFQAIARIMLGELAGSLKDKGIAFTYDDALVELLTEKSYSLTYGARNLRRTIQKELEDPMATRIIDSYETPITQIKATAEDGQVKLYTL